MKKVDVYSSGVTAEEQHAAHLKRQKKQRQKKISKPKILGEISLQSIPVIKPIPIVIGPMEEILQIVCKKHNLLRREIFNRCRVHTYIRARQELAYRYRYHLNKSTPEIGRFMKRDHSSIINLARGWEKLIRIKYGNGKFNHLIGNHEKNFNWDLIEDKLYEDSRQRHSNWFGNHIFKISTTTSST